MVASDGAARNANIPNGWIRCTVQDIAHSEKNSCVGGPFGSNLTSKDYVDAPGIPVSRGNNLTLGTERYIDRDFVFVSERKAATLIQNTAFPGDLVFTQRGTIGQIGLIPRKARFSAYILSQNQMKLRPDEAKANPVFLYYYFISPVAQNMIQQNSIGSTIPGFNLGQLRAFPLLLPPLPEQRAIAHILGTLDDKIELNRRMNETLEAMARALFKSWFEDFDPVRAKAERCDPDLPKPLADLFPDSFEDSELGEIPKGWEVGTIGSIASRVMDKVEDPADWQQTRLIDLSRMPQRSIALSDWGQGAELTTSVTRFRAKDTLFGAIRPYFHKVGVAPMNGVTNVSVFVVRAKQSTDWPFITILCSMTDTVDYATRVAKGTKMPVVSWPDFQNYALAIPSVGVREAFCRIVAPLLDRIVNNIHAAQALAASRDTLLPKLISGELRVPEVDMNVARTA